LIGLKNLVLFFAVVASSGLRLQCEVGSKVCYNKDYPNLHNFFNSINHYKDAQFSKRNGKDPPTCSVLDPKGSVVKRFEFSVLGDMNTVQLTQRLGSAGYLLRSKLEEMGAPAAAFTAFGHRFELYTAPLPWDLAKHWAESLTHEGMPGVYGDCTVSGYRTATPQHARRRARPNRLARPHRSAP